jgi:hypothetical protein
METCAVVWMVAQMRTSMSETWSGTPSKCQDDFNTKHSPLLVPALLCSGTIQIISPIRCPPALRLRLDLSLVVREGDV